MWPVIPLLTVHQEKWKHIFTSKKSKEPQCSSPKDQLTVSVINWMRCRITKKKALGETHGAMTPLSLSVGIILIGLIELGRTPPTHTHCRWYCSLGWDSRLYKNQKMTVIVMWLAAWSSYWCNCPLPPDNGNKWTKTKASPLRGI